MSRNPDCAMTRFKRALTPVIPLEKRPSRMVTRVRTILEEQRCRSYMSLERRRESRISCETHATPTIDVLWNGRQSDAQQGHRNRIKRPQVALDVFRTWARRTCCHIITSRSRPLIHGANSARPNPSVRVQLCYRRIDNGIQENGCGAFTVK